MTQPAQTRRAVRKYSLVVASNSQRILERNLLASQFAHDPLVDLQIMRNVTSAAQSYGQAMARAQSDIVVFAHQDVYFPPDWHSQLDRAVAQVEQIDPDWALIGATGIARDSRHVGEVWSTSQSAKIGAPVRAPVPVQSLDEMLIVVRRAAGVGFDGDLPGFHLYGTDIVQSAHAAGKGAFVCHLPVVHNDRFHDRLCGDFAAAYKFVRLKWRQKLPIRTTVLWVTGNGLGLSSYRLAARMSLNKRRAVSGDTKKSSREISLACGWE